MPSSSTRCTNIWSGAPSLTRNTSKTLSIFAKKKPPTNASRVLPNSENGRFSPCSGGEAKMPNHHPSRPPNRLTRQLSQRGSPRFHAAAPITNRAMAPSTKPITSLRSRFLIEIILSPVVIDIRIREHQPVIPASHYASLPDTFHQIPVPGVIFHCSPALVSAEAWRTFLPEAAH